MKLYLSSIDIPTPNDLSALIGKPLQQARVALIPNAKDYFSERPWHFVVGRRVSLFESLGLTVTVVDLRNYSDSTTLQQHLKSYDLIWVMGGNTFMLRHEMRRSGFENCIKGLLESDDIVYGGDSAGALVAGISISGINLESADDPEFAETVIEEGLALVPYVVVPHADNTEFGEVMSAVTVRKDQDHIITLNDSQAALFNNGEFKIVTKDK